MVLYLTSKRCQNSIIQVADIQSTFMLIKYGIQTLLKKSSFFSSSDRFFFLNIPLIISEIISEYMLQTFRFVTPWLLS